MWTFTETTWQTGHYLLPNLDFLMYYLKLHIIQSSYQSDDCSTVTNTPRMLCFFHTDCYLSEAGLFSSPLYNAENISVFMHSGKLGYYIYFCTTKMQWWCYSFLSTALGDFRTKQSWLCFNLISNLLQKIYLERTKCYGHNLFRNSVKLVIFMVIKQKWKYYNWVLRLP